MNKSQLSQALTVARSPADLSEALGIFDGFAHPDFKAVHCTIAGVARLIRSQCFCPNFPMDGSVDLAALNEIATHGRRKFMVIGGDAL